MGYVYLFDVGAGNTLNPDAGEKLVNYNFNLLKGNYFTNYKFTCDNFLSV